jgi:hypothetical protein
MGPWLASGMYQARIGVESSRGRFPTAFVQSARGMDLCDAPQWILEDAQIREAHLAMLDSRAKAPDPLRQNYLEGLRLKVSPTGAHNLTPKEKRDLLLDGDSIRALHANWSLGT